MEDDVSAWLQGLVTGDELAARQIWHCYVQRMLAFARKRLDSANRRVSDEEDLVVSAFHSLCQRAAKGQFPDLKDRDSLWKLLTTIIARKAATEIRRNLSRKRGAGNVAGESVFLVGGSSQSGQGLGNVAGMSQPPSSPQKWRSSVLASWTACLTTLARWQFISSKVSPTTRSPRNSTSPPGRSSGNWPPFAAIGKGWTVRQNRIVSGTGGVLQLTVYGRRNAKPDFRSRRVARCL